MNLTFASPISNKIRILSKGQELTLSDYTDFQKMIPQIFLIYQCILNLCNRVIIGVIRDFCAFPEISQELTSILGL